MKSPMHTTGRGAEPAGVPGRESRGVPVQRSGELREVKDWRGRLTRYRYDGSGRLIQTGRPNGSREERSYDAAGRLTRLTDQNRLGGEATGIRYTYSPAGLLTGEEEKQYTYDLFKRLIHGSLGGRVTRYTYDLSGNITEVEGEGPPQTLQYSADNRLKSVGGYPAELDASGNLVYVTDGEQMSAYAYDARNRLVKAGKLKYRYSPQGSRTELEVKGKVTRYVVDESGELSRVLMEVSGEGTVKAWYVYGHGLIGREDAEGRYQSYHADLRGSTTLLTDEQGQVTDRYRYGMYGKEEAHEGTTVQPFRYNGRDGVMTDANGLYYIEGSVLRSEAETVPEPGCGEGRPERRADAEPVQLR